ncbi:MAG: carboxypeptidase-like regulatory domain-containing protein, partial [Chitinophagaceae bacterium]
MKRITLLVSGLLFIISSLFAQNRQLKGKVIDESGDPVRSVNVMISGAQTGAQTDALGNFIINATGTG